MLHRSMEPQVDSSVRQQVTGEPERDGWGAWRVVLRATRAAGLLMVLVGGSSTASAATATSCGEQALGAGCSPGAIATRRMPSFPSRKPAAVQQPRALLQERRQRPIEAARALERRRQRLAPAKRILTLKELRLVKRLLQVTPRSDHDHPRLLRRLAATHRQMAASAEHEFEAAQKAARRAASQGDTEEAHRQRRRARDATTRTQRARNNSIAFYRRLLAEHPSYCRFPRDPRSGERGCRDEVLFFLARALERGGKHAHAEQRYSELVGASRNSKYWAPAQAALGELHVQAASSDRSRMEKARVAFAAASSALADDQPLWAYANYRLGFVSWTLEKHGAAIAAFKRVIERGGASRAPQQSALLIGAARRDLVSVFALAGDPQKAANFFRPLSGDPPGDDTRTLAMLEDLGRALMRIASFRSAAETYRQLLKRGAKVDHCRHHTQLARTVLATHRGDRARIMRSLDAQLQQHQQLLAMAPGSDAQTRCAEATAELLLDGASHWHLEAVGIDGSGGTKDTATLAAAERSYGMLLKHFDQRDFAAFDFTRYARTTRPRLERIHYAHGDVLERQSRWADCAAAFEHAGNTSAGSEHERDARIGAAHCFERLHARELSRGVLGDGERMIAAFDRYLCSVAAPRNHGYAQARHVRITLARAERLLAQGEGGAALVAYRHIPLAQLDRAQARRTAELLLAALATSPTDDRCGVSRAQQLSDAADALCRPLARAGGRACQRLEQHHRRLQRGTLAAPARNTRRNPSDDALTPTVAPPAG